MDHLTHSLAGWTLGQTGLKRKSRKGLVALILGANMPDIDVFFGWAPWAPLATHRGFTHGLVGGVLLMPPILAGLLWLLDRWQVRRGVTFTSGLEMHFGWLVALSYLGTLTHPLLDWQTSYAIQLFSPFDTRWYHADTLFIIDIWIWIGLGTAVWLSMRRESREQENWRRPPLVALAALFIYLAMNAGFTVLARRAVDGRPDVIVASPPPALFWQREVIWRENGGISRASYDPLGSGDLKGITGPKPDGMSDPLARKALRATPEISRFMRWSILPVARVEREKCRAVISYNDARFEDGLARGRFWMSTTIPTGAPGC